MIFWGLKKFREISEEAGEKKEKEKEKEKRENCQESENKNTLRKGISPKLGTHIVTAVKKLCHGLVEGGSENLLNVRAQIKPRNLEGGPGAHRLVAYPGSWLRENKSLIKYPNFRL